MGTPGGPDGGAPAASCPAGAAAAGPELPAWNGSTQFINQFTTTDRHKIASSNSHFSHPPQLMPQGLQKLSYSQAVVLNFTYLPKTIASYFGHFEWRWCSFWLSLLFTFVPFVCVFLFLFFFFFFWNFEELMFFIFVHFFWFFLFFFFFFFFLQVRGMKV